MRSSEQLEIRVGLPEQYRRRAAVLCYEAFRAKFEPILGTVEHGVAILERDLEPELVVAALAQNRLVGLVGLEYGERYFFNPRLVTFAREFGWLRGLLRCIIFSPFARHRRAGDLTVGAFAIDAPMRGKGIGTRLMEAVFDWARERSFRSLSLEVVDTNPAARRLYERLGFAPIKTQQLPYPFRRLGFSAVTTMIKEVA
ncbi:MAG: GNAT family N-acetyltransferase [Anaerolineae bacterium]|nr:GNAT family N-acetyltransferase [Anaerolineae bacterium]